MGFSRSSDPQPVYAPRVGRVGNSSRVSLLAVALEAICAFFGIYGVGWLLSGFIVTGLLIMLVGFIWDAIAAVLVFVTFGLAGVCVGPLHITFVVISALMLALARRAR